jgi:hypothetical protein
MSGLVEVIVRVGGSEARIDTLRLAGADQMSVTVSFPLEDSTVSLTFAAERFIAFAEQLQRYAATMPGKPS